LPAELFKEGGDVFLEGTHLICMIWREYKIPDEWKESLIAPVFKEGDRSQCNKYRDISLLTTGHKILSNMPVSV